MVVVVVEDLNIGGLCKFGSHLIMDTKGLHATTIVLPTHVSGRCSFFFFFFFYVVSGGARLVDVLAKSWWMLQLCWRKEIRGEQCCCYSCDQMGLPLPSSPTVAAPILPQFYCSTTVFARFIGVGGELLLLLFFCFCLILCCLCYFVLLCITRYFDFFSRLIRDFTYSCWG